MMVGFPYRITWPLVAAALLSNATLLAAQELSIRPGTRLRVQAADVRIEGELISLGSDTLIVQQHGDVRQIPLSAVRRLDVHAGQRPFGVVKGALIGFGGGLVVGVAVTGAILTSRCEGDACFGVDTFVTFVGPPAIGLAVGALLGGTTKVNRWSRVDLGRLSARVSPVGTHALGVYATLRF